MQMKGYTYQDETRRQVGLAAMENMPQGGASGTAASIVGDVVGLGVTMGAVGTVMGMTKEAITPVVTTAKELGASVNDGWKCPSCGKTSITSLFCPDCGTKKPVENKGWNCPTCGKIGISSLFCPDCGTKKPVEKTTWDCECGEKNISSNFCPSCGHKRGE
jgi:ribosomal protein L32